jgi:hypothetical protein
VGRGDDGGARHLRLLIAFVEQGPVRQARLTLRSRATRSSTSAWCSTCGRTLPAAAARPEEPRRLADLLRGSGVELHCDTATQKRFEELRAMYEGYVETLSRRLLMPLPPWIPQERVHENWSATAVEP